MNTKIETLNPTLNNNSDIPSFDIGIILWLPSIVNLLETPHSLLSSEEFRHRHVVVKSQLSSEEVLISE